MREDEMAKLLTTLNSSGKSEADASALISAQLQMYQKEKKDLQDLVDQYKDTMQSLRDELSNKDILLSEIDNKQKEDVAEAKRLREENDTLQVQMETLNNEMQDVYEDLSELGSQQIITKNLETKVSGHCLLTILKYCISRADLFAKRLKDTCKAKDLVEVERIFVSRAEIDLLAIRNAFSQNHGGGKSLEVKLKELSSKNYEAYLTILLNLLTYCDTSDKPTVSIPSNNALTVVNPSSKSNTPTSNSRGSALGDDMTLSSTTIKFDLLSEEFNFFIGLFTNFVVHITLNNSFNLTESDTFQSFSFFLVNYFIKEYLKKFFCDCMKQTTVLFSLKLEEPPSVL
ncbi:hypothetical protein RFI_25959 [Reticulomyxa filosa]|uniref:Uncharacterized protein n=1 Tax=Reticulomyxa filosa TaxID=46433 RepID=X6MEF8_RETFI|nr:hypothetical protein RFI_25959 [Reticulomyxa filosa]|eukprot:ETO11415.1 hypothetical protein RFI_25959 [Reticulomyxa filosa]